MTETQLPEKAALWRVLGQMIAVQLVVFGLVAVNWWFNLGHVPADWVNYQRIYQHGGGYLAKAGRDPLFVWLVRRAFDWLGFDGYVAFRRWLFGVMLATAAIAAWMMRGRSRHALIVALILVAAFMTLALVQIREGLAFSVLLLSLLGATRRPHWAWWLLAIGVGLASGLHLGLSVFALTWALAALLGLVPLSWRGGPYFWAFGTAVSMTIGVIVGLVLVDDPYAAQATTRDFVNTSGEVLAGGLKYAVCLVNGAAALAVRHQIVVAIGDRRGFLVRFSVALAALVVPAIWGASAVLIFNNFPVVGVTVALLRSLSASVSLSLIILALTGRARLVAAGASALSIAQQVRVLMLSAAF